MPRGWKGCLLYILMDNRFHFISSRNIEESSLESKKILQHDDFHLLGPILLNDIHFGSTDNTCFQDIRITTANESKPTRSVLLVPLMGDGQVIGLIIGLHEQHQTPSERERNQIRFFCEHVQPYLRNAILHHTIEQLAITDGLTGVLNRRAGINRLHKEYSSAQRHHRPLSLIILDIDHFKQINDTHGHQCGDQVLKELCRRITDNIRDEDTLFRYGGEEFVIILPLIGLCEAVLCASRLLDVIRDTPFNNVKPGLVVQASIGVASTSRQQVSCPELLIALADNALYWAKHHGRNQVAVSSEHGVENAEQFMARMEEDRSPAKTSRESQGGEA